MAGIQRHSGRALMAAAVLASAVLTIGSVGDPSTTQAAPPPADAIPDEGLPASTIAASALVSERTEILEAGVVGYNYANDSFPNTNIRVTSFAEIGTTMYVGGKFTQVEIAATGERFDQPFLAAFDRTSGAWIDSFTPTLDGNVWDLKATADGRLVVAGQFTNINGASGTNAVAMLDATTGDVDPTWRANLVLTGSSQRALARTLDIEGDFLYIGGNFTRITDTAGVTRNAGQLARTRISNGVVDGAFLPNINGIVFDVDATPDRVYAAGNFLYVNDVFSVGLATLQPSDGQFVPGLQPYVRTYIRNTANSFQQGVLALDDSDEVWLVGAQHARQVYEESDFSMIRSWVSDPWGDGQAVAELNGFVYTGSHANGTSFLYRDAIRWPELTGQTSRLPIRWMGGFDTATNEQVDWYPQIGTQNGEGSWELFGDSTGCLWTGGDFNRGSFDGNVARYVGGFAKFCASDSTAPEPPTSPTATVAGNGGINLAWTGSTDDRGGQVRYELLKNDGIFASFISIETFRDPDGLPTDRYFVRAMDVTGNRSATTSVFTAEGTDTTAPSTPQDLTATLDDVTGEVELAWTAATDNVAVTEYVLFDAGVEIARSTEPTVTVAAPAPGIHYYQVLAVDAAGNEGNRTPSTIITIVGDDVTPPGTPTDLDASLDDGDVTLTWTAPNDDVGVVDYLVFDTDVQIGVVTDTTLTLPDVAIGDHFYQVLARDAAGNESNRTASAIITIAGLDTTPPRTPINLVGTIIDNGAQPDDVRLDWEPRDPDGDVTGYIVFRNGIEIQRTTGPTTIVVAPGDGNHWYQVRAFDAAGNESFKTPSTLVTIESVDTTPPRTPINLVGSIIDNGAQPDDVRLDWEPRDPDGDVTGYIVFRNGIEIQRTTDPTTLIVNPGAGSHWYQVRAFDAAGNESFKTPSTRIDIVDAAGDVEPPRTPRDLVGVVQATGDVALSWTASVDNVGVTGYIVFRNGVEIQRTTDTEALIAAPGDGDHYYQVRAFDAAGNESFKTPSTLVTIVGVDVNAPNTPRDLVATLEANGDVTLTWTASVDNVGVAGYIVFDTGAEIQRVTNTSAVIVSPAAGPHWFQVRAFDDAGNESFKTPSTRIDL
ncbi:MAG: fibronectin type III domain-containing protein [Ilumatobacter sp.]